MLKKAKSNLKKRLKNKAKSAKTANLVVKRHHTKPYRKRHYGALAVFLTFTIILVEYVIIYRHDLSTATNSAKNFVSDLFASAPTKANVSSTYGFSISYDTNKYFAGAVDTATGNLFLGNELSTKRPYEQLRFSRSGIINATDQSSMTIHYYNNLVVSGVNDPVLAKQEKTIAEGAINSKTSTIAKVRTEVVSISGVQFVKSDWTVKPNGSLSNIFTTNITTYAGAVNSKAMILKEIRGISSESAFSEIISSLIFGKSTEVSSLEARNILSSIDSSSRFLNSMLFTSYARAANQVDTPEMVASKYGPAVVKIYNFYCMDIKFDGVLFLTDVCSAASGSGFFISSDGYLATNGHVASSSPKEILISEAFVYAFEGDYRYLDVLLGVTGIKESDMNNYKSQKEFTDYVVEKFYSIEDSRISATNNVNNLLVGLNDKVPNIEELANLTDKRTKFTEQDSIKSAELIASDYRYFDGIVKWRASDVAILKIAGSNYPVVKTSSIASVQQGSTLTILGFPGIASANGLVEETSSKVTVTSGKVSAIKNANGSDKKLIETDTTIGHGNSGGPAFDSTESVVGLATYGIFASGDGAINYVRDVKDVLDLATKSSVKLLLTSDTQTKWEEGIQLFYNARYSKAVKKFDEVKKLFPQHSKADEFIASANEKIKNGQDVKDFPYLLVGASGLTLFFAIGVTLVVIRRHKVKHTALVSHMNATGQNPFSTVGVRTVTVSAVPPTPVTVASPAPAPPSAPNPAPEPTPVPMATMPTNVINPSSPQPAENQGPQTPANQ